VRLGDLGDVEVGGVQVAVHERLHGREHPASGRRQDAGCRERRPDHRAGEVAHGLDGRGVVAGAARLFEGREQDVGSAGRRDEESLARELDEVDGDAEGALRHLHEKLPLPGGRVVELVRAVGRVGGDGSRGDPHLAPVLPDDARSAELESEMDVVAVRVSRLTGRAVDGDPARRNVRHHDALAGILRSQVLELDVPAEVGLESDAVQGHEGVARDEFPLVRTQSVDDLHAVTIAPPCTKRRESRITTDVACEEFSIHTKE
jgi:hypothetical protein